MGKSDITPPDDNTSGPFDPFDFLAQRPQPDTAPRIVRDVPLFPLNHVLFPQMALPLHIFEPRYRLMINECLRTETPFGVILIRDGAPDAFVQVEPYEVGTLAQITEVAELEDGRFLLNTIGTERFKLLRLGNDKPYMTADIELWPDGEGQTYGEDMYDLLREAHGAFQSYLDVLMALARKQIEGLSIPDDAATLSYLIPNWLRIDLEDKQRLLELAAPDARLRVEIDALHEQTEYFLTIKRKADEGGLDIAEIEEETGIEIETDDAEPPAAADPTSYDIGEHFSRN